jgi:hypothetical protein
MKKGKSMQHLGASRAHPHEVCVTFIIPLQAKAGCVAFLLTVCLPVWQTLYRRNPEILRFPSGTYRPAVTPVLPACHFRSMVAPKAIPKLEWWNCNLPQEQWTIECPASLQYASEKDRGIIGSSQADFQQMSWDEVKNLISKCPKFCCHIQG